MPTYSNFALQKLQQSGLKITKPRKMIVSLLAKSTKALSPYEMRDLLKQQKITADVVTIYRVLEVLEKMALAHKVLAVNGYVRCSTNEMGKGKDACHHYLLCQNCHRVEEVKGENMEKLETKISHQHGFKIQSHYLEFTGLCRACQ